MSMLHSMEIQGIRSFVLDRPQKIKFSSPLTLIHGPNGTGKTTLIECLRYATTGDQPPNARTNGAFIHDPKTADKRTVRAKVRLLVRDRHGEKLLVERSLEATQKESASNVSVRTLEGVLTRYDENDTKISATSRCVDLNKEVISSLDVSDAVLKYVIFCHQEDSTWPLSSDGKALKQRFDEIFSSEKYRSASDALRKAKNTIAIDLNQDKVALKYLHSNKLEADEKQSELSEAESKYEAGKIIIEDLEKNLFPITEKLEKITTDSQKIIKLQAEYDKAQSNIDHLQKAANELKSGLTEEYMFSTEQLKNDLGNFQDEMDDLDSKFQQVENKIHSLDDTVNQVMSDREMLLLEHTRLDQEAKAHQKKLDAQNDLIGELSHNYRITGYSPVRGRPMNVQRFESLLRQKLKDTAEQASADDAELQAVEKSVQDELDGMKISKAHLDEKLRLSHSQLNTLRKESAALEQELGKMSSRKVQLDRQRQVSATQQNQLQNVKGSYDVDAVERAIKTENERLAACEKKIQELDKELSVLYEQTDTRARIDTLRSEQIKKRDQISTFCSRYERQLKHLLKSVPNDTSVLRKQLEDYIAKTKEETVTLENRLQQLRIKESSAKEQQKTLEKELSAKSLEHSNISLQVSQLCGEGTFEDSLVSVQEELQQIQREKGFIDGITKVYAKYISELRRQHDSDEMPDCPLCHRLFQSIEEAQELATELEENLSILPDKLDEYKSRLEDLELRRNSFLELKPSQGKMSELSSDVIPTLRKQIKEISAAIQQCKEDLTDISDNTEIFHVDLDSARKLLPDVIAAERINLDLNAISLEISLQEAKLGNEFKRAKEDVQFEKNNLEDERSNLRKSIEQKQQRIVQHNERVQRLQTTVHDLQSEVLQLEAALQKNVQLESSLQESETRARKLERDVEEATKQVQPLIAQIQTLEQKRRSAAENRRTKGDESQHKLSEIKMGIQRLSDIQNEISSYDASHHQTALGESQKSLKKSDTRLKTLQNDLTKATLERDQFRDRLSKHQIHERNLRDNLSLREKQDEIKSAESTKSHIVSEMSGIDVNASLAKEEKETRLKYQRLLEDIEQRRAKMISYKTIMQSKEADLSLPKYKDAANLYLDKTYDVKLAELAICDLTQYGIVLDKAILSYHQCKMEALNRTIAELWRKTYRGTDIDYIEIRSDETKRTGESQRRQFNYRVVMIKGSVALDMRGRCSAGQKMLASVMIRLALAETFGTNCGILALDEPTTNLDRENIESLANSLIDLISDRARSKHFQLLVITHDVDFVELLGRSQFVDTFWKLSKDGGYSTIQSEEARTFYLK